jgi:translation initiation factor 2 beta subunit (eIF-2beta)/eIF-5
MEKTFEEMLDDIYNKLDDSVNQNNIEKLKLPLLNIEISTTNTYWRNIKDFLKKINRRPEYFINYLKLQVGEHNINMLSSSLSDGIVFKGKFKKDKIIGYIQDYIKKYVICKYCNSYNTVLIYESNIKKYNFNCKKCFSDYNI